MKYFGPPKFRKDWETQIDTPVGVPCVHCEEAIQEGDYGTLQATMKDIGNSVYEAAHLPIHHECQIRGIVGSIAHQQKRCSCFGGTHEDAPELTKRQAAIAAMNYFYDNQV